MSRRTKELKFSIVWECVTVKLIILTSRAETTFARRISASESHTSSFEDARYQIKLNAFERLSFSLSLPQPPYLGNERSWRTLIIVAVKVNNEMCGRARGVGWRSRVANYNVKRYLKEQCSKRHNGQCLLQFDTQSNDAPAPFGAVIVYSVSQRAAMVDLGFNAVCDKLIADNLINSASIRQWFGSRQ